MTEIPCKCCISFAICNAIVKQRYKVYKTQYIIRILEDKCTLFSSWLPRYSSVITMCEVLGAFLETFEIELDVKPNRKITRHLKSYKINKDFEW